MMKDRKGEVYVIHNLVNDKEYAGQTIRGYLVRFAEHVYAAFVLKSRKPLYRAMRRDGIENFSVEVTWTGAENQLNAAERRTIRQRKTFRGTGWGYNLTTGGGQHKVSRQTIRKLRAVGRRRAAEHPEWFAYLVECMAHEAHTPEVQAKRTQALSLYAEARRAAGKPHFTPKAMKALRAAAHCERIITEATHKKMSDGQVKRCAEGRGLVVTDVLRVKRSKSAKKQWKSSVTRIKMLGALHEFTARPAYRSKRSEIAKAQWARMHDEMCAKLSVGAKRRAKTPEGIANLRKASKAAAAPEVRKRLEATRRITVSTPEYKAKQAKATLAYYAAQKKPVV
jgi:hypothetical protein